MVGRLCSNEWGKELEALGMCRLRFVGVGMEQGRKSDSVTLQNFAGVAKFHNPCEISYEKLLEPLLQDFSPSLQK